jgi:hypothetical protein
MVVVVIDVGQVAVDGVAGELVAGTKYRLSVSRTTLPQAHPSFVGFYAQLLVQSFTTVRDVESRKNQRAEERLSAIELH